MARSTKPTSGRRSFSSGAERAPVVAPGELPQSAEAEISVLGAAVLNNETIDVVIPLLKADDFASAAHRKIYEAICAVHEQQRAVDLVTLRDELQRRGDLEAVGGIAAVSALVEGVPSAANIEHYAGIVREKAIARNLMLAAREISEAVAMGEMRSRELLDDAQAKIFQIAEEGTSNTMAPMREVLKDTFARIDSARDRKDMITGLATGFHDLDEILSGLQDGELIIVAGRPSMGKTTFALNVVEHAGVRVQAPCAIFSLEMSREQVARNMLCSHARLDSHRLRRGRLSTHELENLPLHVGALSEAPIYIDDSPGLNTFELRSKVRRLKAQKGLKLVVVDYLQLMQGPPVDSRQQEIGAISRSLKGLAREMKIPVIAVAQLNRQAEQRDNHLPRMADLRESGSLEQDADVVLLLHREAYYRTAEASTTGGGDDDRSAQVIVAKQRNGPTGTVKLTFLREYMRFESCTEGPREF